MFVYVRIARKHHSSAICYIKNYDIQGPSNVYELPTNGKKVKRRYGANIFSIFKPYYMKR
jgi:hypothetical protein